METKRLDNVFCIISAIGNDYGAFTYEERFNQLVKSVESVRRYAPGSDVFIYDASENPLPYDDIQKLQKITENVVVLNTDKYITFLKYNSKDPSPNKFEKKSVGEIQAMIAFLEFLKQQPKKYNRVFKLSGRYQLNENFNLDTYKTSTGKCVFLEKEDWFGKLVFRIRLWSFDYNDLDNILNLFYNVQKHTYDLVAQTTRFELIEYTLTKFIEKMKIPYTTVNTIGVCGLKGLDALILKE